MHDPVSKWDSLRRQGSKSTFSGSFSSKTSLRSLALDRRQLSGINSLSNKADRKEDSQMEVFKAAALSSDLDEGHLCYGLARSPD